MKQGNSLGNSNCQSSPPQAMPQGKVLLRASDWAHPIGTAQCHPLWSQQDKLLCHHSTAGALFSFPPSPSSLGWPLPWRLLARNRDLCPAKLSPPCPGPLQIPQQPHNSTRHQFHTYFCKRKVLRQCFPCKVPLTTPLITGTAEGTLHDPWIAAWQNSKLSTPNPRTLMLLWKFRTAFPASDE